MWGSCIQGHKDTKNRWAIGTWVEDEDNQDTFTVVFIM